MGALDDIRKNLGDHRAGQAALRSKLEALHEQRVAGAGLSTDELAALRAQMAQLRGELADGRLHESSVLAQSLDPRQWLNLLNGEVPVLLMPLRIQTRFVPEDNGSTLLIRVAPDDISAQAFDPRLTATEQSWGQQYMAAAGPAELPPTDESRSLWRGMVGKLGLRRAAWVVRVCDPSAAPLGEPVSAALRTPAALTLPERLVFRLIGPADQLIAEVSGQAIPDGLAMGFDPTQEELGFQKDGTDFEYPPELAWQVDFDAALKVGMGVKVRLDAATLDRGITRLTVLGVRLSTDEKASRRLLEQLIEDHRYSVGFALLPQGTPTNVTQDADASNPSATSDADAALDWLRGEGAFSDGGKTLLFEDECDGLRLAHALGVNPESLRYVDNAGQRDAAEAMAMKRALWAGTLGYYAQHMLWPMFQDPSPAVAPNPALFGERLTLSARFYFTHFVYGRGPLAALRVGDQPYGILPVTGDMLAPRDDRVMPWNEGFIDGFMHRLHGKLTILAKTWVDESQGTARAGSPAVAGSNSGLADVLALQASSVAFHSERFIGKQYLEQYVDFSKPGTTTFAAYTQKLKDRFDAFALKFAGLFPSRPDIFNLSFFGGSWKRTVGEVLSFDRSLTPPLTGDVIDNLPTSESRGIADDYPNYLNALATLDFESVRRGLDRTQAGVTVPLTALLYLVARHSYLYEHVFSAMRLHHHLKGRPWSDFKERELYNTLFVFDRTYWDTLESREAWPAFGVAAPGATALELIKRRQDLRGRVEDWKTHFGDVDEVVRACANLGRLPTARLERLFTEHLDLASYRLDAWITGQAYQRLLGARAWRERDRGNRLHPMYAFGQDGPLWRYDLNHRPLAPYATGIYLGAYGWVENLRPDAAPTVVNDLPAELTPRSGRPVTRDAGNLGLVHAPSLNQATTAALLRSGSATQRDSTAFNIDLSSARVRQALWLFEGVRNGQTPAALLGYRFERGLREREAALQAHLPALRDAFPMPQVLDTAVGPTESTAAKNVVNGLRLVQAVRDGTLAATLAFMHELDARNTVMSLAAGLLDLLDAASDLMLAESVHQSALGNFDRAAGVITAGGEFLHVPDEFEVVQTPRSGSSVTQRVLLAMNEDAALPPPATPHARLAPALNAWLSQQLGALGLLVCEVAYLAGPEGGGLRVPYSLPMNTLGLEPVDLLRVLDDAHIGELGDRLRLLTHPRFLLEHPGVAVANIEVNLSAAPGADAPAGTRAVGSLLPLIARWRALLGNAKPATLRDFVPPNRLHALSPDARDAIDSAELLARVQALQTEFEAAAADLAALAGAAVVDTDALTAALMHAAQFNIREALPAFTADPSALRDQSLREQALRSAALMQARIVSAAAKWAPPALPADEPLRLLGEAVDALLGSHFPLLPRLLLTDDVAAAALAGPSARRTEDWLFDAAAVREEAARLQHLRVVAAVIGDALPALQIYQWPVGRATWIADPGALDPTQPRDHVSIAVQSPAAIDITLPINALVLDEWHELIPNETETTGISFHHDAPNTEPPNTLLLAVSERRTGNHGQWMWDELVSCVDQALVLAKMRTVDPDILRKTRLDAVLPATMAAETAAATTIATSYLDNVSATLAQANAAIWRKV